MIRALVLVAALLTPGLAAAEHRGGMAHVTQQEVLAWIETGEGPVLVDTRSRAEFEAGRVPGAIHIPYDEMAERMGELEPYRKRGVVLYCESGRRAGKAASELRREHFENVRHLDGDMQAWRQQKRPIER